MAFFKNMNWLVRLKAAGYHFLFSLLVAASAAFLILYLWFPWPYRTISGGENLLVLILSVDIVIGPLLTLAIFNLKKPRTELVRDVAIIAALQMCALSYGVYTVFQARPVILALEVDRFRVTSASAVAVNEFPQAMEAFQSLSLTGPRLVNTAVPKPEDRGEAIMMGLGGLDLGSRPSYWRPWDDEARKLTLKAGKSVVEWVAAHPDKASVVKSAVARTGLAAERLLYLPVLARTSDWSVLVDRQTGDPVGFAPIDV